MADQHLRPHKGATLGALFCAFPFDSGLRFTVLVALSWAVAEHTEATVLADAIAAVHAVVDAEHTRWMS